MQKKEPSEGVVFVAVDEPSVNKYGRWPWSRDKIAKGVANLHQADVVLLDMIFSEETQKEEDGALADSLGGLTGVSADSFYAKTQRKRLSLKRLIFS